MFRPSRPSRFQAARFETELARREGRDSFVTPVAVDPLTETHVGLAPDYDEEYGEDFPSEAAMTVDSGRESGVRVAVRDPQDDAEPVRGLTCIAVG